MSIRFLVRTINSRYKQTNKLSRNVSFSSSEHDLTSIFINSLADKSGDAVTAQDADPFTRHVRDYILKALPSGSPGYKQRVKRVAEQCFLDKGLVWYKLQQANRRPASVLLCPRDLRDKVMDAAHNSPFAGHSGKQRTMKSAHQNKNGSAVDNYFPVSYTHLTLPTNREV